MEILSKNLSELIDKLSKNHKTNEVLPIRCTVGVFHFICRYSRTKDNILYSIEINGIPCCNNKVTFKGQMIKETVYAPFSENESTSNEYYNTLKWAIEVILSGVSLPSDLESKGRAKSCDYPCTTNNWKAGGVCDVMGCMFDSQLEYNAEKEKITTNNYYMPVKLGQTMSYSEYLDAKKNNYLSFWAITVVTQ